MQFNGRQWMYLFVVAITAGQSFAQSQSGSAEAAIRKLDAAWSQAAQAKDVDKMVSYYAEDASVLPTGASIANGKNQIHDFWQHIMSSPGFNLHFEPTKIEVARSGDMAFEIGTAELTMNDASGTPQTVSGKYVVVWKKQRGSWKAAADIFNTDK